MIQTKKGSKPENRNMIYYALFFSLTVFLFSPLDSFLGNTTEFWFSLKHVLPTLLIVTLALFLLISFIGFFLKGRAKSIWAALVFSTGVGYYLQGTFINANYGVLDGRAIDWSAYQGYAIWSTACWIIIIVLSILFTWKMREQFFFVTKIACLVLISTQLVGAAATLLQKSNELDNASISGALLSEGLYTLGKDENVVIFVLDTFDADTFENMLTEDNGLYQHFDGFQYYPDFSTTYMTTKGALPYILTGVYYENDISYGQYVEDAYKSIEYYSDLNRLGYDVRLYTMSGFVPMSQSENIHNKSNLVLYPSSELLLTKKLYQYTMFRYMPHMLKPLFWLYTGEFDSYISAQDVPFSDDNFAFYKGLQDNKLQVKEDKAYRFYHLQGMHAPYDLNENMERHEGASRAQQAKGMVLMLETYLEQLKELNLYDNTTIIVTADHSVYTPATALSYSRPLFMIKPRENHGEMKRVATPASHADLIPTVMEEILKEASPYGFGLTNADMPMHLERRLLYYTWDDAWSSSFLPALYEYSVSPEAWDSTSYQPTGRIYGEIPSPYKGELIDLTQKSSLNYVSMGFEQQEEGFSWSIDEKGYIIFPVDSQKKNGYHAALSYSRTLGEQRIRIAIGNIVCIDETLNEEGGTINFDISPELINDMIYVQFEYPDAISPLTLGINDDGRILAVQWTSMQFSPIE